MPKPIIRNIDDAVIDQFIAERSRSNRSLEGEVRYRPTVEELLILTDKFAAMTPKAQQTDSVELLRENARGTMTRILDGWPASTSRSGNTT